MVYNKEETQSLEERRIQEFSTEMVAEGSELPLEQVQENDGLWSLPGGWCDVLQSVGENAVKETREEAGLEVAAESIIAVQDRARHNRPDYAYGVCKVFVLCRALGGSFQENIETIRSDYFPEDALPPPFGGEKNPGTGAHVLCCLSRRRRVEDAV